MDVAEWLKALLAKRSQLGSLSNELADEAATCRRDAINDGVDLHDLQEAASSDLVGFLGGNRVQSLYSEKLGRFTCPWQMLQTYQELIWSDPYGKSEFEIMGTGELVVGRVSGLEFDCLLQRARHDHDSSACQHYVGSAAAANR